jgi:hypothetical protein
MDTLVLSGEVIFGIMLIILAFIIGRDFPTRKNIAKIQETAKKHMVLEYICGTWVCVQVKIDLSGGPLGSAILEITLEREGRKDRVVFVDNNYGLAKGDRVLLRLRGEEDKKPMGYYSALERMLVPVRV